MSRQTGQLMEKPRQIVTHCALFLGRLCMLFTAATFATSSLIPSAVVQVLVWYLMKMWLPFRLTLPDIKHYPYTLPYTIPLQLNETSLGIVSGIGVLFGVIPVNVILIVLQSCLFNHRLLPNSVNTIVTEAAIQTAVMLLIHSVGVSTCTTIPLFSIDLNFASTAGLVACRIFLDRFCTCVLLNLIWCHTRQVDIQHHWRHLENW